MKKQYVAVALVSSLAAFAAFSLSNTASTNASGIAPSVEKTVSLAPGTSFSLILTSSGKVYACGNQYFGQLGNGVSEAENNLIPTPIPGSYFGNNAVTDIFTGENDAFVKTSNGDIYAWGSNFNGELANGGNDHLNRPTLIPASSFGGEAVSSFALGFDHSLALTSSGKVYAWGNNNYGQLGNGTEDNKNTPTLIPNSSFNGEAVTSISCGHSHSLALTSSGNVYAWGDNGDGQLGNGSKSFSGESTPMLIAADHFNGEKIISVEAGFYFSFALTSSGNLFGWGSNSYGQVGNGTFVSPTVPSPIPASSFAGESVSSFAAGGLHSLALTSSGTAYAWGYNTNGQIGDGTVANKNTPTLISASRFMGEHVSSISGGGYYSLALTSSGDVYAWGANEYGQLCDGTQSSNAVSTPERIVSMSSDGLFASALSQYKTCTEYNNAYAALADDYDALSANQKANLAEIDLKDYASAEDYSSETKSGTVTAANKWAAICALHNATEPNKALSLQENARKNGFVVLVAALTISALICFSAFTVKKKQTK